MRVLKSSVDSSLYINVKKKSRNAAVIQLCKKVVLSSCSVVDSDNGLQNLS